MQELLGEVLWLACLQRGQAALEVYELCGGLGFFGWVFFLVRLFRPGCTMKQILNNGKKSLKIVGIDRNSKYWPHGHRWKTMAADLHQSK